MEKLGKLNEKLLLIPKMLYFFLSMNFYTLHQFRGPFIMHKYNVSKGNLGMYFSIAQLVSFGVNLWIAAANDRYGKQRKIITGLVIICAICFHSFFSISSAAVFWMVFGVYFSLLSATLPLLDKVILDYLNSIPDVGAKEYGRQRLWASFGYLATNFSVERISDIKNNKYENIKYYNLIIAGISGFLIFSFVGNLPARNTQNNYFSSIMKLLRNLDYTYFIFIIILCGVSRASMTIYLGVYYKEILGWDSSGPSFKVPGFLSPIVNFFYHNKQSTTTVFGVTFEIIVFFKAAFLVEKLGLFWPLFLAQFFQLARFVCYYNLDYMNENSFIYVCLIELLKGMNYSLIHISAVSLATKLAPPSLKTTSQIIYNGAFIALGTVISGVVFNAVFSPSKGMKREVAYEEFLNVFRINIWLSIAIILLFLLKYGILENLLFNSENAINKIRRIEEEAEREEISENELKKEISV